MMTAVISTTVTTPTQREAATAQLAAVEQRLQGMKERINTGQLPRELAPLYEELTREASAWQQALELYDRATALADAPPEKFQPAAANTSAPTVPSVGMPADDSERATLAGRIARVQAEMALLQERRSKDGLTEESGRHLDALQERLTALRALADQYDLEQRERVAAERAQHQAERLAGAQEALRAHAAKQREWLVQVEQHTEALALAVRGALATTADYPLLYSRLGLTTGYFEGHDTIRRIGQYIHGRLAAAGVSRMLRDPDDLRLIEPEPAVEEGV